MSIIEEIKAHEKEVSSGKVPNNLQMCLKCNINVPNIKLHERRYRLFLIVDNNFVRKVWTLLSRWKYNCCNSTFTYYPPFAIPYKHYVYDSIMSLSRQYIADDKSTYRNVVQHANMPIGYENDNGKIDECRLEFSTPWRWLSFIGSLENTLREALNLIRQKSPTSGVFRKVCPLNPRKYRSEERKKLLQKCMQLFNAEDEFKNIFAISIFPHFATKCSWG